MASSTAIEECTHNFISSSCPQIGCLHDESTTTPSTKYVVYRNKHSHLSTTFDDANYPTSDQTTWAAFPIDPAPRLEHPILRCPPAASSLSLVDSDPTPRPKHRRRPDPVISRSPAAAVAASTATEETNARDLTDSNSSNGSGEGGDGIPLHLDPEAYVLQKHYHTTYSSSSRFRITTTETPILISHLRPAEQNAAYESLLSKAPRDKVKGYYELHLSRLKDVREDVWKHEAAMRGLFEEWKREEGMGGWIEGGRAEMVGRVYKSMVREGERLRAGERGVGRLLGLCEVLLEGEEGFERVGWRRGG